MSFQVGDYVLKVIHTPLEVIEVGSVCRVVEIFKDSELYDIRVYSLDDRLQDVELSKGFELYQNGAALEERINNEKSMYDSFIDEFCERN